MTAETVIASDRMPNNIKAIQLLTAVYMVQVGESRMKTVRYYRLFTVSHSTLYDVTALLAVSLDIASRERLYSASGDNSNHDLRQLQNRINTLAGTRPEILRPSAGITRDPRHQSSKQSDRQIRRQTPERQTRNRGLAFVFVGWFVDLSGSLVMAVLSPFKHCRLCRQAVTGRHQSTRRSVQTPRMHQSNPNPLSIVTRGARRVSGRVDGHPAVNNRYSTNWRRLSHVLTRVYHVQNRLDCRTVYRYACGLPIRSESVDNSAIDTV